MHSLAWQSWKVHSALHPIRPSQVPPGGKSVNSASEKNLDIFQVATLTRGRSMHRSAALDLAAPTSFVHAPHFSPAQATALLRPSVISKLVVCAGGMQSAASAPSEAQVSTSEFTTPTRHVPRASFVSRIGDITSCYHAHFVVADIEQRSLPSSRTHRADCCRASGWVSISMMLTAPAIADQISDAWLLHAL